MYKSIENMTTLTNLPAPEKPTQAVVVGVQPLTIEHVVRVARFGAPMRLTDSPDVWSRVHASCAYINNAIAENQPIYGVTTGFGGMANLVISREEAADLQNNAIWFHKAGAGKYLPLADVRAAMLLRVNSHMHGVSGIREEIIRRLERFLNAGVTPLVPELGSIGASGDLVPLTYITGALIGLDACFKVDMNGQETDALTALERLGLDRLRLGPKEGLAMINGTSVMTGIAANCMYDFQVLLGLTLAAHALIVQALRGTNQSFHPFIHQYKPHPGQRWVASHMLALLDGSQLCRDELDGQHNHREQDLIQDRYSLRCLPQYLGPIIEGLVQMKRQIETELNSANDNPLIDPELRTSYHGGNFLGQYVGMTMDQLRQSVGLLAKHLDVQIALLVTPAFSNGLPPSLVGNTERHVNMGLKALQLVGNSIMPLLTFFGNSLVDRFPTHAEQYNQNINSQGFGSANLARQSLDMFRQYIALALMFGVQAVDLRTKAMLGHYDARESLSPTTRRVYEAVRAVVACPPSAERPYIRDDHDQALDLHIARIAADIAAGEQLPWAINETLEQMARLRCGSEWV